MLLAEDIINRYNSNPKIRPFLTNYPYTVNNLTYVIRFQNHEGRFWLNTDSENEHNEIAHISAYRGVIHYDVLKDRKGFLTETFRETYEEAKKTLEEEKNYNIEGIAKLASKK